MGDELPEDDPPRGGCGSRYLSHPTILHAGARELAEMTSGADHVMLLGITCGFSAPYVAGQIDHALQTVGKEVSDISSQNCKQIFANTF